LPWPENPKALKPKNPKITYIAGEFLARRASVRRPKGRFKKACGRALDSLFSPSTHRVQLMGEFLSQGKSKAETRAICGLVSNISQKPQAGSHGTRLYGSQGSWEYAGKGPEKGVSRRWGKPDGRAAIGQAYFEVDHFLKHWKTKKGIFVRLSTGSAEEKSSESRAHVLNIEAHIPKGVPSEEARLVVNQFLQSLDKRLTQGEYAERTKIVSRG